MDFKQTRLRDNIMISLKEETPFIEDDESAISELDELAIPDEPDRQRLPSVVFSEDENFS